MAFEGLFGATVASKFNVLFVGYGTVCLRDSIQASLKDDIRKFSWQTLFKIARNHLQILIKVITKEKL